MAIKKHDFVEIEYTGTLKGDNEVFDTTKEDVAKKQGFYRRGARYGPLVVCVGEQFLVKGLDGCLIGKEIGREYTVDISPEQGFGRKDTKLLQMIPASKFRQSDVQPFPGLKVNVDNSIGTVKTVSGGRVMVDFNHPLSGRELSYTFKVLAVIDDEKKKVDAFFRHLGLDNLEVSAENGVVTVKMLHKIDEAIEKEFAARIKGIIPSIKEVRFVQEKKNSPGNEEKEHIHPHEGHGHHN